MTTIPLQLVQEAQLTSEATSEWTPVQELEILRHWSRKQGVLEEEDYSTLEEKTKAFLMAVSKVSTWTSMYARLRVAKATEDEFSLIQAISGLNQKGI